MSTDDLENALAECIAETGVERYRWLCSDANTHPSPNSAADYRRWILARGWKQAFPVDYRPVIPSGGCGGCGS